MTDTKRLYYEDVYIKEFSAKVVECRKEEKGFQVILDQSAFYPEGGGQPSDLGILGDTGYRCSGKERRADPLCES